MNILSNAKLIINEIFDALLILNKITTDDFRAMNTNSSEKNHKILSNIQGFHQGIIKILFYYLIYHLSPYDERVINDFKPINSLIIEMENTGYPAWHWYWEKFNLEKRPICLAHWLGLWIRE
jgi:hypothetical protein